MKQLNKAVFLFAFYLLPFAFLFAQPLTKKEVFTKADTLRGSNGPGRDWWDAAKYDLHVKFNLKDSSISGWNEIQFKYLKDGDVMQIDLQAPLTIDSIIVRKQMPSKKGELVYAYHKFQGTVERNGNAYFLKPQTRFSLLG